MRIVILRNDGVLIMRVDNNGNYKVYATKLMLNNQMEFGIFAASLPALERAYAAVDKQQLLISDLPFNYFEVNKATVCKGWGEVFAVHETLACKVVQLEEELATANTMHVDNERYKWEQLGFGSLDELIEHFLKAKQELAQFKSVITSEVANFIGAGVKANYGKESVNDAMAKYWVPVVGLLENTSPAQRATKYPAGQCKHGVILYGNECLNCTRESEQGQGGAA